MGSAGRLPWPSALLPSSRNSLRGLLAAAEAVEGFAGETNMPQAAASSSASAGESSGAGGAGAVLCAVGGRHWDLLLGQAA